eukprot:EG_transcript_34134
MRAALLIIASLAAWATAAPFAGAPALWDVKITESCEKGRGLANSSMMEGTTGLEQGCYASTEFGEDFYVTCSATHLTVNIFVGSSQEQPCGGKLSRTVDLPLGQCVNKHWTGHEKPQGFTYSCAGMWCNATCDKPPCPMDFPCPKETACCLNDNRFDIPCGTVAGCSGEPEEGSWLW